ncbi:MAG: hypothetical protein ASARMPREDX12_005091 [Alectoria sarmentosa]|nr:MAG: hypothetical protein ASARMPREDX12_005091 [Alectoria sarmentosa]
MQRETQILRLPHPYSLTYHVRTFDDSRNKVFRLSCADETLPGVLRVEQLPEPLHNESLSFSVPRIPNSGRSVPLVDNTSCARALRSPLSVFTWNDDNVPTLGQLWLVVYFIFTLRPNLEAVRILMTGDQGQELAEMLLAVGLAVKRTLSSGSSSKTHDGLLQALVIIPQITFWQGAGSPLGVRAPWAPDTHFGKESWRSLTKFPPPPLHYTFTTGFPASRVHARHPVRPPKPPPGSIVYSRYIPHLDEMFSMVALDYWDEQHLDLFHRWQNDPRVARGWNETGSLDEHQDYLRRAHEDSHLLTLLGKFNDEFFAYFEVYWAKEDHVGAYYDAGDYDRGRHFLVGDQRYRGPHRVSAWGPSLVHYLFLDEPRTWMVVEEPKATNSTVLAYDSTIGFNVEKVIDLPHKRSAFEKCSRERFFQLSPFTWDGGERMASHSDRASRL